jgi:hypothetical protein
MRATAVLSVKQTIRAIGMSFDFQLRFYLFRMRLAR